MTSTARNLKPSFRGLTLEAGQAATCSEAVNASIQAKCIDVLGLTKDTLADVEPKQSSFLLAYMCGWFMMRCSAHASGQASHADLLVFSRAAVKASDI